MTTPQQVAESRTLMQQQAASREAAVAAAVALAVRSTRTFDGWYSTAAITVWASSLARGIETILASLARQTDAYTARQASILSGRTVRPVGAIDVTTLRPGVTHAGVYARVADAYRWQQSQLDAGKQVQSAIEAAVSRVSQIAEVDTQLVVRAQSQKVFEAQPSVELTAADADNPDVSDRPPTARPRLLGYRRIVHPELSAGGSCGLCIAASTRLYRKSDLMPIHFRCNCIPMAVYEGADPGGIINDEDLARFYADAGSTSGPDLKKTRYQIDEHGELGPVLNPRGASFRDAADVADDER